MQEVGKPICTQINNPHARGSSVVDGDVSRIQIHLEARLHLDLQSVTTRFLKLWPLHQQPQVYGDIFVSLMPVPCAGSRGDADLLTLAVLGSLILLLPSLSV